MGRFLKTPNHNPHEAAIKILKAELKRREERLQSLRPAAAQYDFEPGMDRDQYVYCMGRADECREMLMCLGVFDKESLMVKR